MKNAIVTICSDNYVKYTKTLLNSFYKKNPWYTGDFIILYDNVYTHLSDESISVLCNMHDNVKCICVDIQNYINICKHFYANLAIKTWVSCVLKFYLFELGNEYDKVLYVDSDIIINTNLQSLFDKDLPLAAVSEGIEHDTIIINDKEYFNAGVLYFGTNEYLNSIILSNILDFANNVDFRTTYLFKNREVRTFWAFEQDVLNTFFMLSGYNYYLLPNKFNTVFCVEHNLSIDDNVDLNDKIIHYWTKPDKCDDSYKAVKLWKEYIN